MDSIKEAIKVLNYAIKHNISANKASVKNGYSETYVKNVKRRVNDRYENDTLSDSKYNNFMDKWEEYQDSRTPTSVTETKPQNLPKLKDGERTNFQEKNHVINIEWQAGGNYPADHVRTLDQLLSICDVDPEIWSVKDYAVNKWDITMKEKVPYTNNQTKAKTYQNFQVKAKLEKNLAMVDSKSAIDTFKDMVANYTPPVLRVTPKDTSKLSENNLFEVNIFDLHIGKLAWAGETGENYDVKIASYRFMKALENLIKRAEGFEYSRILFPVGNDFFNSDNLHNTTTKGTPQDEDLRWQKTINIGNRLIVDGIELLKQTGVPIDVVVIPGNHDFERSTHLGEFLGAWFRNDDVVNINNGASPRKYYEFGKVLLGLTHGSEEKEASLPLLMASEEKEMWGRTNFHEWHLGHIHRKRTTNYVILDKGRVVNEDLGVTVRYLSSLSGTEEWHHKRGYVGSNKAAEAFLWNDETGLIGHLNTNLVHIDNDH